MQLPGVKRLEAHSLVLHVAFAQESYASMIITVVSSRQQLDL